MGAASFIAASGATACEKMLAMGAYVIANKNSTAFKSLTLDMANVVAQNGADTGAGTPTTEVGNLQASNVTIGLGVKVVGQTRNMQQGAAKVTNNTYDIMIQGNGYFVVTAADGKQYYTRAGNFKKSADGSIVTHKGLTLSPGITVPANATAVTINESGEVIATVGDAQQNVGQIQIATFGNDQGIEEVGDNLYIQKDPNDNPVLGNPGSEGRGTVYQGALEESNVQIVEQLIQVMQSNTTFGLLMKIIEADKKHGEAVAAAA